jgi:adhesin/invasin
MLIGCGETLTQVGDTDVAELRLSADSAEVGVGRDFQLRAYPLDATRALVIGASVTWQSADASIASVDDAGLVTGVAMGHTSVVATSGALTDTTFVAVELPPILALSADSVGFDVIAGGASPTPQSVTVTNAGVLALAGLSVDSIGYGPGVSDWLAAVLDSPTAPAALDLTVAPGGTTTAGVLFAHVFVSAVEANGSPADVLVTLTVASGAATSLTIDDGNDQTATAGAAVATAPSVRLVDAFENPVVGTQVAFAVTGGGGIVTGAPATVNAAGIARLGSWTLGNTAGPNQVMATFGGLTPVVFDASGVPGPASQVVVTAGANQSAVAGSPVATPPSVAVQDANDNGVVGVAVTFTVAGGGGNVTGANQTTGPTGVATVGSWTLGPAAGPNSLTASAAGVATPATIDASGLTGQANSIAAQAGNAQADTVAATLAVAYSVRVVDTNLNGVQGVSVLWSVTGGGGTIAASATSTSVATDANGVSTAVRVLGTAPGAHTATAAVGGLAGSPVQFTATASVGSPDEIRVDAGNGQSATVNTDVPVPPQVIVEDKFDNPIEGHAVTFAVQTGGGTVSPLTAVATLANGTATVTSWTLGTAAGVSNNTLRATAAAPIAGTFVTFTASATAGNPTSVAIVQGNGQTATTGTNVATAPTVVVRDQFTNPVSGRTINFTTTGGSVGSAAPTTNASGQASTTWAPNVAGGTMQSNGTFPDTLFASVQGTGLSTSFTASARYSYATHLHPVWAAASLCTSCHGGTFNLTLSGTASQSYAELVTELTAPACDASLATWRRVRTDGGDNGHSFSILRLFMEPTGSDAVGLCGPHPTKVSAGNLAIIRAWIRNGAPNN